MTYASSIQTVTDANGTVHAFLENDGLLWQCKWNAQAQRWDQAQVVPGAYGGEKLQALLVDNLWPTSGSTGDQEGNTPGIVLAYRIGSGEAAKVYATIGRWGSDGELSWNEPLLLSDSGTVTEAIGLRSSGDGSFELISQRREPAAADPGNTLQTLTGARSDSELIKQSFSLSGSDATGYQLTNETASKPPQDVTPTKEPAPVAPASATAGSTEFSRADLLVSPSPAIALLRAPSLLEAASSGLRASANGLGLPLGIGWSGGFGIRAGNPQGQYTGVRGFGPGALGQTRARWQLVIPNSSPQSDWLPRNAYRQRLEPLSDSVLMSLKEYNQKAQLGDREYKRSVGFVGAFGTYGYGTQVTRNDIGITYIIEGKKERGSVGRALDFAQNNGVVAILKQTRNYYTFLASLQTKYYFGSLNLLSSQFNLEKVKNTFSATVGWDRQVRERFETGGYLQYSYGFSFGYAGQYTQKPVNTDGFLPEALKWIGYSAAVLGPVFGLLAQGQSASNGFQNANNLNSDRANNTSFYNKFNKGGILRNAKNAKADPYQRYQGFQLLQALAGVAYAIAPPISNLNNDSTYRTDYQQGLVVRGQAGIRYLWKSIGGFYGNLRVGWYDYFNQEAFKKADGSYSDWQFKFQVDGGLAFPFGVSIPILAFQYTLPKPYATTPTPQTLAGSGSTTNSTIENYLYLPASGSTLLPTTGDWNGEVALIDSQSKLQLFSLNTTTGGAGTSASSGLPLVLNNRGSGLTPGTYVGIPILGELLPGSAAASLSFTVGQDGTVDATSVQIQVPTSSDPTVTNGQYLFLPETSRDSGFYALIPDVFSTGILQPPADSSNLQDIRDLRTQLPVITARASTISTPTPQVLTISDIVAVPQVVLVNTSTATGTTSFTNPIPSDNSLRTYKDVPVSLNVGALNTTTASVSLSNGSIVKVVLDDPLYLSSTPSTSLTLTVDLLSDLNFITDYKPTAESSNPVFTVTAQVLGYSNVVEDQSYSANPGAPANSDQSTGSSQQVWLADGINDQWQQTPTQGGWPVFNRVVFGSFDSASKQWTVNYLNGSQIDSAGRKTSVPELEPANVTLASLYKNLGSEGKGPIYTFSAASTPTVITVAGQTGERFANSTAVFWVEASKPVIPVAAKGDGSTSYQDFLNQLYGSQQINYRIKKPNGTWEYPNELYAPVDAVIRHLKAFAVEMDGTIRTLLVWDETSISTIKDTPPDPIAITGWIDDNRLTLTDASSGLRIGDLISGDGVKQGTLVTGIITPFDPLTQKAVYRLSTSQSLGSSFQPVALNATPLLPPTVLKAGFLNPAANSIQWSDLFSEGGSSTITTIPWDQTNDIGVGIESLSVASKQVVNASGQVRDTAVLSWSEDVRTPYVQSVLNDQPLIYLQFADLQPGFNDINIGSTASETTTGTTASSTGLNFTIASALSKSSGSAVQNIDGTGVIATGTGSQNSLYNSLFNSTPINQRPSSPLSQLTGTITGSTLTLTALSGELTVGDLLTGPGLAVDTQITAVLNAFDAAKGTGQYSINTAPLENITSSTAFEAVPDPAPTSSKDLGLPYASFSGSINGTTLTVSQLNGSLAVGDLVIGEGITFGTSISAVLNVDASTGLGEYQLSADPLQQGTVLAPSALIATPSSSVPYTIEFWTKLPSGSNSQGAGLVAFGQPSTEAVGPAVAPSGWLMTSTFTVQRITVQQAAAQGFQDAYDTLSSNSAKANDLYAWGWSLDATGANTTALNGNGGSNVYSNALSLTNLYSGQTIGGVDAFLDTYGLDPGDLPGGDGQSANTIDLVPGTSLDFNISLDPDTGLPVSNLNAVSIDTASSQLNSGLVVAKDGQLSSDPSKDQKLKDMFQALWDYQETYASAKVAFSLDPAVTGTSTTSGFEQYGGLELTFSVSPGPAISVNQEGQLVFDVADGVAITSDATSPENKRQTALPADLRDDQWHYVVATYLPTYRSYTINGVATQVPTNRGTARLYVDNQLVASQENVSNAYLATNINDTALLLPSNAGGAIDQFALYNKALLTAPPLPSNPGGLWPEPGRNEALTILKQLGYPATADTPNPGAIDSAISEHWRSRDVNPNNALLATFSSSFTPSSDQPLSGSWSQAAPLNPIPELQATIPSATAPVLAQDLVIPVQGNAWSEGWTNATSTDKKSFNPGGDTLEQITVTLTPDQGDQSKLVIRQLSPLQILMGSSTTLAVLQPAATSSNLDYTFLSSEPALNLLISRKANQQGDSGDLDPGTTYTAEVKLSVADPNGATGTAQVYTKTISGFNAKGSQFVNALNGTASSTSAASLINSRTKALATAAVIEQAPLQLKYIDSGVVLKSATSQEAANNPATPSPAPTFGQSMAYGWFSSTENTASADKIYSGWLAVAQPSSANAISDPAGRVWIQYTGNFESNDPGNEPHKAVSDTATAPKTWLNALANSNFSPEVANRPLLNDKTHPSTSGGLLVKADPTLGWGQNFAQTMLVADIDDDGVLDLVISAPSANGGGKVVIIDGEWIKGNLNNSAANSTLNLASPDNAGTHVLVLSPAAATGSNEDSSQSAFGWALAFDSTSKTLYIGAPNYSRTVGPDAESVPIGAVYQYNNTSNTFASGNKTLSNPALGLAGRTDTNDVSGPASTYWGAQLGASLAASNTGKLAIGAPGVEASLLYSGTEAVNELLAGKRDPSAPYGQGTLIKVMLPTSQTADAGVDVYVTSNGTDNKALSDVISSNTTRKKSDLASEESTYMSALKELQTKPIAKASPSNNSAIQAGAVGSVYLIDINNGKQLAAGTLKPSDAQATFYGPNPLNIGGATDFGASLAFGDAINTNTESILAVGAPSTGGPGAVYLINTSQPFGQPSTAASWIKNTNLGANQYLAYLTSGLTLYGAEDLDQFGTGVVNLGDTNGDGYDDLLVQAPNASSGAGNGYVVFGNDKLISSLKDNQGKNSSGGQLLGGHNPASGSVKPGSIGNLTFADDSLADDSVAGNRPLTTPILSLMGYGISAATGQGSFGLGDVDANGNNDILLGSGINGQGYLTYGHNYLKAIGNLQLQKLASNTGYLLEGLATRTQGSLRSIGDLNGDGYGDFLSRQPGNLVDTVRIELGANTQDILARYNYNYYTFQVDKDTEVIPVGDLNGDGYSDIALFLQQNLSTAAEGNAGAGSTTGILYGRPSDQLPLGSGFGLLAPVDASSNPLAALPTGPISGALSTQAPAMLATGSTIYAVWCDALAGSTNLWFAQSRDGGSSWSTDTNLTAALPALASSSTPSLTLFNDKLYLSFRNGDGQLALSSWNPTSGDPTLWSNPTLLSNGGITPTSLLSPSLIVTGDALSIVWVDDTSRELQGSTTTTPDLYSSSGSLGTASAWKSVSGGVSPNTPALANEGNTVYMAMRGENSQLYWNSSSDGGQSWRGWQELPSGMTSNDAPSLAIVNGSPYLTYLGAGNQQINITRLTDPGTNSWSTQTVLGQTAKNGKGAVAISETVNGSEGLAIYYVANNTTGTILRTWSANPSTQSWSTQETLNTSSGGNQTASGPLAVTRFNGQTYLAYQGGTPSSPSTIAYITTANALSSPTSWTLLATRDVGNDNGIGLSSDAAGLLLNTSDTGTGQQAIYRLSPPAVSGSWSQSFYSSRASISSSSPTAALLSLPSNGNTPQLLLAAADQANAGAIDVSAFYPEALNSSWSSATPLLERLVTTDGSVSFQPITASAAPSATLINGSPVLAVNNGDRLSLYTGSGGRTFSLASSFNLFSSPEFDTTPAGITTTDTGLALSYRNSDGSVNLQRLNFLKLDGTPVDGVMFNADGSIDTSNANLQWQGLNLGASNGLSTALASVPLSVNGTLLLGSTSDNSNQVQLSAIPVLSNPGSTTWLNSTVQLPDGQGGWSLQQQAGGSNLSAVGDLTGDGNADLLVTAAADQSGGNTFTGLRLISGAATSSQILAANDATASSQTVQVAASFGSGFSTPVASLSGTVGGVPQLTLTATDTTSGEPYSLSAGFNLADFSASAGNLPSAQEVFSSTAAPTAVGPGLGLTFGDLSLSTSSSFGDLNADGYLDFLEGTPTTVYGANGLGWHVWSIRAAGDVNGNGTDDILLSLVPPETVLNDAPQWIQPVLVDGALFEVDRATNSFSFNRMRRALNPDGVLLQEDLNSTSSSQPWPLLQNWLQPILAYEHPATNSPGAIDFSLSSTPTIGEAFPENVAASVSGENGLIYLLSNSSGTVSISQYDPSTRRVMWTKAVPTPLSVSSSTNSTSYQAGINSATLYKGRLYFVSTYYNEPNNVLVDENYVARFSNHMVLSSIDSTILAQTTASANDSTWDQQWAQDVIQSGGSKLETYLSPSLVNEDDRLGLYYATNGSEAHLNLAYYYLQTQNVTSAEWISGTDVSNGLVRANNGDFDEPAEFVQLNTYSKDVKPGWNPIYPGLRFEGMQFNNAFNIAAARFQQKTYVAYVSNANDPDIDNIWVIERPEDPSQSGAKWNSSNRIQTNPQTLHLNANETQLILTAWNDYVQGYSNTYVFESRGIGKALKQNNLTNPSSTSILTSSPSDLSSTALIGSRLTLIRRNGQLQTLATPWSSVKQSSLAGYSIDGNIDVNGDGFMDMLVSDPSDPGQSVDNQYVLFGGDYLNIASKVGTTGDDVMLGTPLADVIYTIQGADQVISHGGKDVIYTAAGDDSISIRDNAFIRIDAGAGFDILQLEGLANQSYDFRLNVPSPEYFAGTKLGNIELISSLDYGANQLSFDAAAVNAINSDRVLFLTPDANDTIRLSNEFNRSTNFDTSLGGSLWSAYTAAPASATPASSNPALVYVAVPTGQTAGWLSTNVSLTDTPAAAPASALRAAAPAGTAASDPPSVLPTTSPIADTQAFGDGLTLLAYRSDPASGVARFAIERSDTIKRQVVLYASSSANGSAEPGSHYTAVAGLLVFEPGQTSHEVTVAIDSVAFARLGSGSLSLQVEELQDQGQTSLHLLITPTAATAAAALQPVLSSFELSAAENATSAILSFRADSTSGNPDSLQLTVSQRDRADSDGSLNSQNLQILDFGTPTTYPISSISDPVPLDNDGRKNDQVSSRLKLNFTPASGERFVSILGPAPVLEQTVQQVGTDQIRFQQNGPLTSWRSDSGSGLLTFALQAGSTSQTLLTAASGGSVGSIDPARALDNRPQAGWQGSEGLAVGSRSITTVANLSAQAWTPTATRNGVALNLQDISINGNQVTARFQGGVSVEFWQASGTAPSLVPIAPAVEVKRLAGYNNTIGFYSVDSITGLVDGRSPGEAGYLQAALARSEAEKLLLSAAELPAFGQSATFNALPLNTQQRYGVLVLQNGDRNTLFSSFSAANPGGETQMVRLGSDPSSYVLGIEDLAVASGRSDRDFNDNILTINGVSLGLF